MNYEDLTNSELLSEIKRLNIIIADKDKIDQKTEKSAKERVNINFEKLFEVSSAILTLGNLEGYFTYINPSFIKILGYTKEELLSRPFLSFIHKDDVEKTKEKLISANSGITEIEIVNRYICKDSSIKWIKWNVVVDLENNLFYAAGKDQTDRKEAEKKLIETENLSKTMIQSMPGLFYIFNQEDAKFVRRNNNWISTTGYSNSELDNMTALDFFQPGYDQELCAKKMHDAYENGSSLMENNLRLKNGKLVPYFFNGHRVLNDGKEYLVGVALDISEQKKYESELLKYKTMVDNVNDVVFTLNREGIFLTISPQWKTKFGYELSEGLGKVVTSFIHPDDHDECISFIKNVFRTGEGSGIEYRVKHKNGSYKWHTTNASTYIVDEQMQFVGISRDITDYKNNIKEKEEMQKLMYQSSRLASIGELAAGIAHEINNPLAIINGYGDMLSSTIAGLGIGNSEIQKLLDEQKNGVERIRNIVDGLRVYARMEKDNKESINVNKIVYSSVDLIKNVYERNDNTFIELNLPSKDLFIYGNKGRFQQIIMNLLSNAKDAMKDIIGGVISIDINGSDKEVRVSVSDRGHGIKTEDIDKIFDTFFTTKEAGEGTGMGLSIVSSLVKDLNSTIEVESKEGEGAKFMVTIPRYLSSSKDTGKEKINNKIKQLKGNVLVVDDEQSLRYILKKFLEMFGLSVDEAENGEAALAKIKTTKYDAIITDIKMPKMNGDQLIKEMAKIGYLDTTKVFVITGGVDKTIFSKDSILNQLQIGIIQKPFSKNGIYKKLAECIELHT